MTMATARITIHEATRGSWAITDQSTITILDGADPVASGPVADHSPDGQYPGAGRVVTGLAALGWRPTLYPGPMYIPDGWVDGDVEGFEIDVEPLS